MTGLAVGGALAASGFLSKRRPLLVYAALEFSIAILGLAIVLMLPNVVIFSRPLFRLLSQHDIAIDVARFAGSFVVLALPATGMGLTLPIAIADPIFGQRQFRRALAVFYGCNTLGAVIGTLSGEMYLIRAFGVTGAAVAAALFNLVAAGVAFAIARFDRQLPPSNAARSVRFPWRQWRRIASFLLVTFGTGAVLLSLEVVWFRFLRLYIASTATAFAIMLAVVLAGIALGAMSSAFLRNEISARVRGTLANLLLIAAIVTLATYVFFPMSILQRFAVSWQDFMLDTWVEITVVSLALMFPTAFISGMLFPLTVNAIESAVPGRSNSVGIATLLNTVGAAAGPLVTSFILLPACGFQTSLIICAVCYALLAVSLVEWSQLRRLRIVTTAGLMVVFVVALILFPYRRNEDHFAHARQPFEADGSRLVAKCEGNSDTWQLLRRDLFGQPYYSRLLTNAFSMSSTQYPNQRYMRLFAYLPLTLQPHSQQALLICYGCGVTADALTQDRQLRHIDIVDLSKEVLELANYYPGPNPLRDPRVANFVQDGRFFLQTAPRKYDIITGEPPPPKTAGTVNIYTEEFFRLMCDGLNDGGIATFWLPIYQLKVDETKAIVRAFHNAFANASLWASSDDEWIMMGIKGSTTSLDRQQTERLWQSPETRADLARIGIELPEQLAALFVMDAPEIERITNDTAPLTDLHPKRLTDARADRAAVHNFSLPYLDAAASVRRFRSSSLMSNLWPAEFQSSVEQYFVLREIRYQSQVRGSNKFAELDFYLRHSRVRMPVLEVLGSDEYRIAIAHKVSQGLDAPPNEALPDLVADALASREFPRTIALLEEERSRNIAARNDLLLLVYLYCLNGDVGGAERVAADARELIGHDGNVELLFGNLRAEFGFRPPG